MSGEYKRSESERFLGFAENVDFSSPESQGEEVVFFSLFDFLQSQLQEDLLFLPISWKGLPISFHPEFFSKEKSLDRGLILESFDSLFHFPALSFISWSSFKLSFSGRVAFLSR